MRHPVFILLVMVTLSSAAVAAPVKVDCSDPLVECYWSRPASIPDQSTTKPGSYYYSYSYERSSPGSQTLYTGEGYDAQRYVGAAKQAPLSLRCQVKLTRDPDCRPPFVLPEDAG